MIGTCREEERCLQVFEMKGEGRRPFGRPRHGWEYSINVDLLYPLCIIIMFYMNQLIGNTVQGVFYIFVLNCSKRFGVIFTTVRSTHSLKLSMVFCPL